MSEPISAGWLTTTENSTRRQARAAGFLYLAIALSAPVGLLYVPTKLIVSEDSTATAARIRTLRLHGLGIAVASVFWGLWLFPFGMLVIRSGFIPRVLGVLLMIAGAGYLAGSSATLLFPRFAPAASQIASLLEVAELPVVVWLLIWGAKAQPPVAAARGQATR